MPEARVLAEQAWNEGGKEVPEAFVTLLVKLGEDGRAQSIADGIVPAFGNRGNLVSGFVSLRDFDRALELIRQGIEDHDRTVLDNIRVLFDWDPLRGDPRFDDLLALLRSKETHTAAFIQDLEGRLARTPQRSRQ